MIRGDRAINQNDPCLWYSMDLYVGFEAFTDFTQLSSKLKLKINSWVSSN